MPHEYLFDIKLSTTARLTAENEAQARDILLHGTREFDTQGATVIGCPELVEIDGETPPPPPPPRRHHARGKGSWRDSPDANSI